MEEISAKNYIVLGVKPEKLLIFKALESLCNNDSTKDILEKSLTKFKDSDPFDMFKSTYKIRIDNNLPKLGASNTDSNTGKLTKASLKRKLTLFNDNLVSSNDQILQYLCPLMKQRGASTIKGDKKIRPKWFSEKLIASNYVNIASSAQNIFVAQSVVVYSTPIFYKSRATFTVSSDRIQFQILLNEWCHVEIPVRCLKSITVFGKFPLLKVQVRSTSKIADEINKLSVKYVPRDTDVYRSTPRKAIDVKDTILVLTGQQLTEADSVLIRSLLGAVKVDWNESGSESKELVEAVLHMNPHLSNITSNHSLPNWASIFTPPPTDSVTLSPAHPNVRLFPQQTQPPNILFLNCAPPSSTPTKFDSTHNIFHRMRTDTHTHTLSLANGSAYKVSGGVSAGVSVASLNQFLANGARPSPSSSVLGLVTTMTATSTTPPVNPPHITPNTLMYIPGRNLTNVFETFHYSPSPHSDVLIHGSDLLCLNYGQYLNDNIINFYLNYIRYEIMSDDQRQRTHLFNVFFNTKLQGSVANMVTDTADTRHARVAKWTKKVDIFDKDFIIIPINENQHWFLAIVCFPWMAGMISYDHILGVNNNQMVTDIPPNDTVFAKKIRVERVERLRREYGVDPSPCILLFDSLQYQSRAPNVKLIRDYLKSEWDSKRLATDGPLVFDKNTVRGFNPQVPQQNNNIDCGIFVLHYVEQFFQKPLKLFTKEYFQSSLLEWFDNETVAKKRAAIQEMVLSKADEHTATTLATTTTTTTTLTNTTTTNNNNDNLDDSGPDIQIL